MSEHTLFKQIDRHPKKNIALSDGQGTSVSYQALLSQVDKLAEYFSNSGMAGVAVQLDNGIEQVVIDLAALKARVWTLVIPPFFTQAQVSNALERSGCQYCISAKRNTERNTDSNADGCIEKELLSSFVLSESVGSAKLYLHKTGVQQMANAVPAATAKITFTSGSTAEPKGLCLSAEHLIQPALAIAKRLNHLGIRRHLSLLPYAVLLENVAGVYSALISGTYIVIPSLQFTGMASEPLVDFQKLWALINEQQIESCIVVPELLRGMCASANNEKCSRGSLKFVAVGGARVGAPLLEKAHTLGIPVYEGYGLSEAASVVTLNEPRTVLAGSAGKVLAHQRLSVAEDGELMLAQPSFLGYCGDHQAPPCPFPTGDIGHIDEAGYVFVSGRKKNVIITSMGRNVSPEWIESLLLASKNVAQAFVFGDDQRKLSALLVSAAPINVLSNEIDGLNAQLPNYAQIGYWTIVAPFTRNNGLLSANGKIRRTAIMAQYQQASQCMANAS